MKRTNKFLLILIFLFAILLIFSLGKKSFETFLSIADYNNLGCNGSSFDGCLKNNGMNWCVKNCRNAKSNSPCNGDTWKGCIKHNKIDWCQNNCKDSTNKLYKLGISDIL